MIHGKVFRAEKVWIDRNVNTIKIMVSRHRHTAKGASWLEWYLQEECFEMGVHLLFSRVNQIWTTYEAAWHLYGDINSYY
jgi:hypothetical protein